MEVPDIQDVRMHMDVQVPSLQVVYQEITVEQYMDRQEVSVMEDMQEAPGMEEEEEEVTMEEEEHPSMQEEEEVRDISQPPMELALPDPELTREITMILTAVQPVTAEGRGEETGWPGKQLSITMFPRLKILKEGQLPHMIASMLIPELQPLTASMGKHEVLIILHEPGSFSLLSLQPDLSIPWRHG